MLGGNGHWIGILNEKGVDRNTTFQCGLIIGEDAANLGLIEFADGLVGHIEAFDHGFPPVKNPAVGVESTAALILPSSCHGGNARGGMHVYRAISLAGKAVTEAEKGAFRGSDEVRKGFDVGDGQARYV